MPLDLEALGERVRSYSARYSAMEIRWSLGPISSFPEKRAVFAYFEGSGWIADIGVWTTGESELGAKRQVDGLDVNKHYELPDVLAIDAVLEELLALISEGTIPLGAHLP